MGIHHQKIPITDPGFSTPASGTPMKVDVFPENVVVPDSQFRFFSAVFEVLGLDANCGEWVKPVVGTNYGRALDNDVGIEAATRPNLDAIANRRIGADVHVVSDDRTGTDNGTGMDFGSLQL
jgi:hypothetical protein